MARTTSSQKERYISSVLMPSKSDLIHHMVDMMYSELGQFLSDDQISKRGR